MKNFTPFFTLLFIFSGVCRLHAQNFEWAKSMGGTGNDNSKSVAVDALGNVYTTGGFEGTVDFDPGPGESILTSAGYTDIFISKVNASGNLVWVKQIGGDKDDYGNSIALDASGNVLTTGYFRDTVDFDPGAGTFILSIDLLYYSDTGTPYIKGSDIFISKLDSDGNFVWARQIGGNLSDVGTGIAVDGANNVFTTGEYSVHYTTDSCDFDPGPGIFNLGEGGGFISKLDESGNFFWAKRFGVHYASSSGCGPTVCVFYEYYTVVYRSVALDASGNVYATGSFIRTNDFDPGPGIFNLTYLGTRDVFVCKLDNAGNFGWAKQMGGSGATAQAEDIAVDDAGNVHTTGYFSGKVDYNPGTGTNYLTSSNPPGTYDVFVSKLNSSGNYAWAKSVGAGGEDRGASIALDAQANVYYTGYFNSKVDFDPGTAKYNLTASGNDVFVSKLTNAGNFSWAAKLGGSGDDRGNGIAVDLNSNVLTTGSFTGTADFDPNSGTYNLISAGGTDAFVQKMNQGLLEAHFTPPQEYVFEPAINKLLIYPNPSNGNVTISIDDPAMINGIIQIITQNGQLVNRINIGEKQSLDIHLEEPGLYFIQLISNNQMNTQKLSVVH